MVGPLRPGVRPHTILGVFPVGNACGESHPLIGEGISMALQSSKLLVECLAHHVESVTDARGLCDAQQAYAQGWRKSFMPRLRLASLYAHITMCSPTAVSFGRGLRHWPQALTTAARLAGKARAPFPLSSPIESSP